ncbi:PadR family transcriptional regulator [Kineosporia rhizophila]|uniref:PadR family transcriptional regulator n=1 Tax=Kineosporia TaxID=49184 RepID=UPI000AC16711|nr:MULTISPECIES: helix-turn-helix transcriptional regulator [Kineosporia]MCE0538918.1 PadR family transcriptional regulator [Kineosporia rhizophila]GLY16221.1 PadR family transcriptional regulator [Kineosporia sp. NBRC 101677]
MSVTRLLVLGAVRIFQPTHGYFVRRELGSWQVAEWAHLNPGSVYNALRGLTREGLLVEEPDPEGGSKKKMVYRLTVDGDTEFQRLVRKALWELHPFEQDWISAGISFWWVLSREEVVAALTARISLLEARVASIGYTAREVGPSAPGQPEHVVEMFHFQVALLRAEQQWVGEVLERIRSGSYGFAGEPPERAFPGQNPMLPAGESDAT